MGLTAKLERYFEFQTLQTNWRTEVMAGLTTWMTMAYILFVNPSILGEAGMPVDAVTVATCVCSGLASILMGVIARYPIALAPGMGLNAYFAYTVVRTLHIPWQVALAAVFVSGALFLLLTVTGFRSRLVRAIPSELTSSTAAGIGLFIAFVGLRNAGIVVSSPATSVALGNLQSAQVALACLGLLITTVLLALRVRAAILIGILAVTVVSHLTGHSGPPQATVPWNALSKTAFHLDFTGLFRIGLVEVVFVFLFVDLFDNLGTLVGVAKKAGLVSADGSIPRVERILLSDSLATMIGGLLGTSTVTSYVESASGIAAGGRSGVTAITTGLLFFASVLLLPVAAMVPAAATAPALIVVGGLMMGAVSDIQWDDPVIGIPAFLVLAGIPLTFSIATGMSFGFIGAAILRLMTGRGKTDWVLYAIAAICLLRFTFLGTI